MNYKTFKRNSGLFLFLFTGIVSTIWFLVRVIPKPSRATYPCMRAAAPFMSGFVIYLTGITGAFLGFRKVKEYYRKSSYKMAALFSVMALVAVFMTVIAYTPHLKAVSIKTAVPEAPNTPMGTPKGYWPGRVAWVMDKNATSDYESDTWYTYTDLNTVRQMLANGIRNYADTANTAIAWDCLFKYFNKNHNKKWVGYKSGEKIVVKLNHTNLGSGGHQFDTRMDATPEMVYALLEELIDTVGVAQTDITIGDPYRGFPDPTYTMCHDKYPSVHYIEGKASEGREEPLLSAGDVFFTSDTTEHAFQSRLPQVYLDASYMINMPCFKSHGSAGITLCAKNHQGSVIGPHQTSENQSMGPYLHYDLPGEGDTTITRQMGVYRHLVDFMGHSKLGGNTLIYIVDGIWGGRDWQGWIDKFGMAPFGDDYPNSIFISQDAVAIESVVFDFMYNEYANFPDAHLDNGDVTGFPLMGGVQDYIHQAADPKNWPKGIQYDPDHADHSQPIKSLGVHEHWNDAVKKQYSVNLTGNKGGIELVTFPSSLVNSVPLNYTHEEAIETGIKEHIGQHGFKLSPNPATNYVTVSYTLDQYSKVVVDLYTLSGKKIASIFNKQEGAGFHETTMQLSVSPGMYLCKLTCGGAIASSKLIVK